MGTRLSTPTTIPLSTKLRYAYEELSSAFQSVFEVNKSLDLRIEIRGRKTDVDNILEKDAMYRLSSSPQLSEALLSQIKRTNLDLLRYRSKLAASVDKIALGKDLLRKIVKVIALFAVDQGDSFSFPVGRSVRNEQIPPTVFCRIHGKPI